jgi:hypothetical protein
LLALSADFVAIAGVVGRFQKRLGRPRTGNPVMTARYDNPAWTCIRPAGVKSKPDYRAQFSLAHSPGNYGEAPLAAFSAFC